MSTHAFTDKSLELESRFGGWALARRAFAEPGVEPHYGPSRVFDILGYEVSLTIDPVGKTLRGEARIDLRWLPSARAEGALDLDELTVDSVESRGTGGELSPIEWRHVDGKLRFARADSLVVKWHGSPRRGLYFVGATPAEPTRDCQAWSQCQDEDAHFILPCIDHPSVKHPWRIRVQAPEGFDVVSNGRREGDVWVVDAPMPAYLFSVIVARLDRHVDRAGDLPLSYWVPAGTDERQVKRAFHKTPRMVEFLASLYGPYPWARYDQVVVYDFIFGGMENLAATTLVDVVLVDEVAAPDSELDSLVVHELGHQWWGDLVTCQDWSQSWLNEGWATYTEYLWYAHDRGQDEASYHLWENLQLYLGEDAGRYRRPMVSYLFREPIDMFDRHIYEKGALVVHTLRTFVGEEAFWAGIKLYQSRHANGTVHTRHLQRAFEDASGLNLDGLFAQWVYAAGHPALTVDLAHADGQLTVSVKQTQEGEGVAPAFRFPLNLAFGEQRVTLEVTDRARSWSLPCPQPPEFVSVDPGFKICADIALTGSASLLAAALGKDACVVGRIRAAKALATNGAPSAIDALVLALRDDPFWAVRAEVAEALASTGSQRAMEALLAALGEKEPRARRRVVAALSAFRRREVADALVALRPDPSIHVRGEVARVLGRLRDPRARALCESLLEEPSWSEVLRARALEGLGALRDPDVFDLVLLWTKSDKPMRARTAAVAALARLGDEVEPLRIRSVERLLELAEDESFRVSVAAVNGLGSLRDSRALRLLQRVHELAGDGRMRRLAWEALANIREGRTTEAGLGTMRKEFEALAEENRKLRDRVTKLEDRP